MERTLTTKGVATRQRIVDGAAGAIRERGVANISLDDVCQLTRTSKSQLFHYFPGGRSQLLSAVARHEADRVLADQEPYLSQLTSWRAWTAWRNAVVERYRAQGRHCPLSVLVGELGRDTDDGREIVVDLLGRWQRALAAGVRHMQQHAKMDARLDADCAAAALVAGIQGGVVALLATGDIGSLTAALDLTLSRLRFETI
jgi:AcrR family transcriptional regulator